MVLSMIFGCFMCSCSRFGLWGCLVKLNSVKFGPLGIFLVFWISETVGFIGRFIHYACEVFPLGGVCDLGLFFWDYEVSFCLCIPSREGLWFLGTFLLVLIISSLSSG